MRISAFVVAGAFLAPPPAHAETAAPAERQPAAAVGPQQLLEAAIRTLESRRSVSAKVFQEIDLFGKRLIGQGSYIEQRKDDIRLMRLELSIQLGDQTSSLLQVCDGRALWTYRKLLDDGTLRRLDVARATEGLRRAENTFGREAAGALPGLGGLPRLLRGLDAAFDFTSAQRGVLKFQADRRPAWQLQGWWKPHMLARILPEQKKLIESAEPIDMSKLPGHLPNHVLLLLGEDDLFPYRIEYRRTVDPDAASPSSRPVVTMQLFEVVTDAPIPPNRFHYNPGDMEHEDETEQFLKSLGVQK